MDGRVTAEDLREVHLFRDLEDAQIKAICRLTNRHLLGSGERLFSMGDPFTHFFFVRRGRMKISRASPEGAEKIILVIGPGETFAEALMFMSSSPKVYPVNADAIEPSELFAIEAANFRGMLADSVESCFKLMSTMSQRLHQLVAQIDALTLHSATYRLVTYLLGQLPDTAVHSRDIQLTTSKLVIASQLAIQPETFSRILQRLQRSGLIEVRRDHVVLRDVDGLKRLLLDRPGSDGRA